MDIESPPTRPIYISRINTIWDALERAGVIPVVRPTVPRAEAVSKPALRKGTESAMEMTIAPHSHSISISKKRVTASMARRAGRVRTRKVIRSRPRRLVKSTINSAHTVTVFMPPAVEPEEPPMSIKIQLIAMELSCIAPWSMTLNPAVRRVADWKKALSHCSHGFMPPKVSGLAPSSRKKNTVPPSSKKAVMPSTSLE